MRMTFDCTECGRPLAVKWSGRRQVGRRCVHCHTCDLPDDSRGLVRWSARARARSPRPHGRPA